MRKYLSFGGGVNSVALYLHMIELGEDFEAVFVDHKTDWPETYEYVETFRTKYPLTVLNPNVEGFESLYEYFWAKQAIPSIMFKKCTDKFKVRTLQRYQKPPAFINMGIDFGESHRAKISTKNGFENRYPLIEAEMDRNDCLTLIKRHGLSAPMKSGCFICPFQKPTMWVELRKTHPDLFCKARQLENRSNERRLSENKKPIYLNGKCSVDATVDENQRRLWPEDEYPPCQCAL